MWNPHCPHSGRSKQFIWMQQHISTHQFLPCNTELSSCFCSGSDQHRLPERLCQPNSPPCLSAHQGQGWNGKRSHGPIVTRQMFNKSLRPSRKPTSILTQFGTNWYYGTTPPGTFQHQNSHRIHDHYWNNWNVIQQSIGPIPHRIQQRQQVCHHPLHLWCKFCQIHTHQKPDERGALASVQVSVWLSHSTWIQIATPEDGQQKISWRRKLHSQREHMAPIHLTQQPLHQSGRMGNLDLEESLLLRHYWASKNLFYCKLMLHHWSNGLHPQHSPSVLS